MARTASFFFLALLPLLFLLSTTSEGFAEEIALESCDHLPVVQVKVSGVKYLFLVDTAATSMLNLKSFFHGDARNIAVTSWNGTVRASAQEVILADLTIGQHHFKNLKLPAVDLSAIGHACGRVISGILGIDLLGTLGATVELKEHAARLLLEAESDGRPANVAELQAQLQDCEEAFNRADERAFSECLDPEVVIFTVAGDYYGRDAAMQYYRGRYFQQNPPPRLSIIPRAHHALGEAIWVEYDLRIVQGQQEVLARGTALCQKKNGKWRIAHMNHSRTAAVGTQ